MGWMKSLTFRFILEVGLPILVPSLTDAAVEQHPVYLSERPGCVDQHVSFRIFGMLGSLDRLVWKSRLLGCRNADAVRLIGRSSKMTCVKTNG